jgi:hypothetical protein
MLLLLLALLSAPAAAYQVRRHSTTPSLPHSLLLCCVCVCGSTW